MAKRKIVAWGVLVLVSCGGPSMADDVRYFEKDGITYRETRRTTQRPVRETHLEDREQTVYRRQVNTELQEMERTVYSPVTEYQWQNKLHGRWNPFTRPYITQQLTPTQRWEARTEVAQIPVSRSELVAEQRTVRVPVTRYKMAQEEVVSRVAVDSRPSSTAVASAPRTVTPGDVIAVRPPATPRLGTAVPIFRMQTPTLAPQSVLVQPAPAYGVGGVARLENDPPRRSTAWRPARTTLR